MRSRERAREKLERTQTIVIEIISFPLFGVLGVCLATLGSLFFLFCGYGKKEEKGDALCEVERFTVLWCIWLQQNARIFKQQSQLVFVVWDKIIFLTSLWLANGYFLGLSLT